MRLELSGILTVGDPCRVSDDDSDNGAIHIGGVDLVDEVAERAWGDNVTVSVNGRQIGEGAIVADLGYAYSEWTPIDNDRLEVGSRDLLDDLRALDGKSVSVVVTDEA